MAKTGKGRAFTSGPWTVSGPLVLLGGNGAIFGFGWARGQVRVLEAVTSHCTWLRRCRERLRVYYEAFFGTACRLLPEAAGLKPPGSPAWVPHIDFDRHWAANGFFVLEERFSSQEPLREQHASICASRGVGGLQCVMALSDAECLVAPTSHDDQELLAKEKEHPTYYQLTKEEQQRHQMVSVWLEPGDCLFFKGGVVHSSPVPGQHAAPSAHV